MIGNCRIERFVLLFVVAVMFVAVPSQSFARQSLIRGTVVAGSNGENLQGVNITLRQGGEMKYGAVSGNDGVYAIASVQEGIYLLQATFVGFTTFTDTLRLGPSDRMIVNIVLEEDETELGEVVVEGDKGAGTARVLAGQTTITPADVELIPGPDISGATRPRAGWGRRRRCPPGCRKSPGSDPHADPL